MMIPGLLALLLVLGLVGFWLLLKSRNLDYWIAAYVREGARGRRAPAPPGTHVYFCFADHFEPYWGRPGQEEARRRARSWIEQYPVVAARHRDSAGRPPRHSFFYPEEEYDQEILDGLASLVRAGYGDVEVHLHHDADNAAHMRETLLRFTRLLHEQHGLLRREGDDIAYCFIHGNWALDNSRPDGRWCGVDDELKVLVETGCRCDMTMPSAPSDTQTRKINSIYFARGRTGQRKAHDHGRDVRRGQWGQPGELLLVQGPLTLNWRERRLGLVPRIESGEISADAPPRASRVALWESCGVRVEGAPEHLFIKVHTHGAEGATARMLFEEGGFETLWSALEAQFRDRPGYTLHYVSAWEMYEKIRELALAEA
jgi:hypothetical protein